MKYAVEMAKGGVIYIPRFIKFGESIQKLLGVGTSTDTQTAR
jgi:hypothetical protein